MWRRFFSLLLLAAPAWAVQPAQNGIIEPSPSHLYVPQGISFGSAGTLSSISLTANVSQCYIFTPAYTLRNATKMAYRVVTQQAASHCSMCIYTGTAAGVALTHSAYTAPACTTVNQTQSITGLTAFTLFGGVTYTLCFIGDVTGIALQAANVAMPTFMNQYVNQEFTTATSATSGACPSTLPGTPVSSTALPIWGLVSVE